MHSAAIIAARPAWAERLVGRLHPGAYAVVLSSNECEAIEGRKAGFELRDTILLLWPQTTSFAFLLRWPSDETTTDQAGQTHSGVLNIEACRIEGGIKQATAGRRTIRWGVGEGGCTYEKGTGAIFTTEGRWPPNVLLIHGPRCERVGEAKIAGHKGYPNGPGGSSSQFSQKGIATTRAEAWKGHADEDGKETITVWDCQPDCPAALLDALSGTLRSERLDRARLPAEKYGAAPKNRQGVYPPDIGGASRFYPQFATPWELLDWLRALVRVPGGDLLEEV